METDADYLWQVYGEAMGIQFRATPNREFRISADGWLALTGEAAGWLSAAYVRDGPHAATLIREYAAVMRARGCQATAFLPHPTPPPIAEAARAVGWRRLGTSPLMTYVPRDHDTDARGYAVEAVATAGQLRDFQALCAQGFGVPEPTMARIFPRRLLDGPSLTAFVARRDGVPMSTATLVRSGPLAGIFWMATPAEHRRKGAGWAALHHATAYSARQGVATCYLAASEAGRSLYERLGFRTVVEVTAWEAGALAS